MARITNPRQRNTEELKVRDSIDMETEISETSK
jgi:hypothetical protein